MSRGMDLVEGIVGAVIPLSFGTPGLTLRARTFTELARIDGRHAVVTGANSGIGRATTERLLRRGARVTMVCRHRERAEATRAEIEVATGCAGRISIELCDMSRLGDVARLAPRLCDPIDIVIHNAGAMPDRRIDTEDGLELAWATHIAGPHLLMRLLRPRLAPTSRIVLVSSGGMYLVRLGVAGGVPEPYAGVRAYALTKRAQVVLAELWSERDPLGPFVVAMHPGWVDTAAVRSSLPRFRTLTRPILRVPRDGADTLDWLADHPLADLHNGGFYFDRKRRSSHVLPWQAELAARREALWRWCTDVTDRHVSQLAG